MAKLEILKDIGNHKAGSVVEIAVDADGVPTDLFWRKRVKESKLDSCVRIVEPESPKPKKGSSKTLTSQENKDGNSNS